MKRLTLGCLCLWLSAGSAYAQQETSVADPVPPETTESAASAEASQAEATEAEVATEPSSDSAPTAESPTSEEPSSEGTEASAEVSEGAATDGEAADAEPAEAVEESTEPKFIKGNLIHVGTRQMLSRFDHVGISSGPALIGRDLLLNVDPGFAYYGDMFAVAMHVPMRLLAVGNLGDEAEFGEMRVRREDWDEVSDFGKIIRFFSIGRKEDNFYLTLNSLRPATIGHGQILDKYQANIDVDRSMLGLIFDAYNDYAGFQFQMNDVMWFDPDNVNKVIGGLAFVKPLSLFSDHWFATSFSVGAEYLTDLRAPKCIKKSADGPCVKGSGYAAGFDPYTGEYYDDSFIRTDSVTGLPYVEETTVTAAGLSVEAKVLKVGRFADVKLYGTYHQFLNEGGGAGAAGGMLGRFNAGTKWISAFRIRTEYRNFGDGFQPAYFDSLYETEKYSFAAENTPYQTTPTKFQAVFGDPENGFERESLGTRHGYNLEFSYGLFKESRRFKKLAFGFGLQDSTGYNDSSLYAHIEFPALDIIEVFSSYIKTNARDVQSLFTGNPLTADNAVLLAGVRVTILPFLFVNAHFAKSFRSTRSAGSEYHLGNSNIVSEAGKPSTMFPYDRLYENVPTVFLEMEMGFDYRDDEEEIDTDEEFLPIGEDV